MCENARFSTKGRNMGVIKYLTKTWSNENTILDFLEIESALPSISIQVAVYFETRGSLNDCVSPFKL